ncbi:MAG: hypothetical protein WCV90_05115 [Candidatus Woesearchaeota archaeon]|jgi:hypothetical protein
MGTIVHQAAYIYVYSKKLYRVDHDLRHLHGDVQKYTSKYHLAKTIEEQQTCRKKLEKSAKKYHELVKERQNIQHKLHEHLAGLARMMRTEQHFKL